MAKKKPAGKKPARNGVQLMCYTDPPIREALDAYLADFQAKTAQKPSLRNAVEEALRRFLQAEGFWPWPRPPGETPKGQT